MQKNLAVCCHLGVDCLDFWSWNMVSLENNTGGADRRRNTGTPTYDISQFGTEFLKILQMTVTIRAGKQGLLILPILLVYFICAEYWNSIPHKLQKYMKKEISKPGWQFIQTMTLMATKNCYHHKERNALNIVLLIEAKFNLAVCPTIQTCVWFFWIDCWLQCNFPLLKTFFQCSWAE